MLERRAEGAAYAAHAAPNGASAAPPRTGMGLLPPVRWTPPAAFEAGQGAPSPASPRP
ncbi:hypothetical protein FAIPA1_310035 [Frankia sp. AiPs1]